MSKHRQEQARDIARKAEKSAKVVGYDEVDKWIDLGTAANVRIKPVDLDTIKIAWEGIVDPPVEEPASTFSQCVIGYRQWVIDALGQLRAFTMFQQIWKPGVNEASCRPMDTSSGRTLRDLPLIAAEEHQTPHADCHCGLYGWNDLAPPTLGCANLDSIGRVIVYGAIAAWGDLQVHATGFRASHACPVALAYDDETEPRVLDLLLRVADEYRVKFVHIDALQAEAEQHGMPLPDDARPPKTMLTDSISAFYRALNQTGRILYSSPTTFIHPPT